ncbi:hypothetical protein NVS47_15815, partial [Dehalobacterium formicoaceticum]
TKEDVTMTMLLRSDPYSSNCMPVGERICGIRHISIIAITGNPPMMKVQKSGEQIAFNLN